LQELEEGLNSLFLFREALCIKDIKGGKLAKSPEADFIFLGKTSRLLSGCT